MRNKNSLVPLFVVVFVSSFLQFGFFYRNKAVASHSSVGLDQKIFVFMYLELVLYAIVVFLRLLILEMESEW